MAAHPRVGAAVFVEEFGEAFEHDPAQLLGVDDCDGATVITGHVMADADWGSSISKRSVRGMSGGARRDAQVRCGDGRQQRGNG